MKNRITVHTVATQKRTKKMKMNRSVFGWDLPPGVTTSMLDRMYGEDEPLPNHCTSCGRFLPKQPFRQINTTTRRWCDGKVRTYYDEYKGQKLKVGDFVHCKEEWGQYEEHEPHWYDVPEEDIMIEYHYRCRCGAISKVWE